MCTKAHRRERLTPMVAGAYEGQTIRMSDADGASVERRRACEGRSFPWWSLWLIWPLIGVAKWLVPLYLGAIGASLAQLSAAGLAPVVAIALIVIGLLLIGRRSPRD